MHNAIYEGTGLLATIATVTAYKATNALDHAMQNAAGITGASDLLNSEDLTVATVLGVCFFGAVKLMLAKDRALYAAQQQTITRLEQENQELKDKVDRLIQLNEDPKLRRRH